MNSSNDNLHVQNTPIGVILVFFRSNLGARDFLMEQLFNCITFVRKFLLCSIMYCACFWAMSFSYVNYFCRTPDISVVGTIFNVLSYDAVLIQDSKPINQPTTRSRCAHTYAKVCYKYRYLEGRLHKH